MLGQVKAKAAGSIYTKSGLMLGLGETEDELFTALADLRRVGCELLTLGQYLQPTLRHLPVVEFVTPEKFAEYGARARTLGFLHVASAPRVRSSYHADEFDLSAQRGTSCGFRINTLTPHTTTAISRITAITVATVFNVRAC